MDGDVRAAAAVEPGRIEDVAAVLGLVPCVGQQYVGQLIARIAQHVAHVALALVVEEAVGGRVDIAEVLGAEGLDDVAGLVVEFAEVIRVGLDLHTQALALNNGQQLFHRLVEHAVADLLLVGVAREFGVDDRHAHVDRNLDHALPVGDRMLALLLGRAGRRRDLRRIERPAGRMLGSGRARSQTAGQGDRI